LQQRLGSHGAQLFAAQVVARSSAPGGTLGGVTSAGPFSLSHPGDAHEREADRVADVVMRTTERGSTSTSPSIPPVQRACAGCEKEISTRERADQPVVAGDTTHVHRSASAGGASQASAPVAASIHDMKGGGAPLSAATRALFEPRFGADFSQVRVHTDAQAADTASAMNARAFTLGRDIAFNSGQYAPHSQEGQRLLAHELTHVVQQSGGSIGVVQRWGEFEHKTVGNQAQNDYPYRGTIPTDMTALRSSPRKDGKAPHDNTKADIRSGATVLVVGKERGWLKVVLESGNVRDKKGATVPAQSMTGYVSRELVTKSTGVFDAELPVEGGLTLTYGDLVAFGGDHFKDFAQLVGEAKSVGGLARLKKLRDMIDKSATQSVDFEKASTVSAEYAQRFIDLALENIPHFSHGGTAIATWSGLHSEAVGYAFAAGMLGDTSGLGKAYAMNAFADHFLTDSFSSGHIRVPREEIITFYKKLAAEVFSHLIDYLSARLGNRIYQQLERDYWRVRNLGDDADRRGAIADVKAEITQKIAKTGGVAKVQEKFALLVAGAIAKVLHDEDNATGLKVVSKKHPEGWTAFGDSRLATADNAQNLAFMTEAVKSSKADLLAAFNIGLDVRLKHGNSPPLKVRLAAMGAVLKKVGPAYAAVDYVPRVADGVAPLPAWKWGSLDKPLQMKLAALIGRYLTAQAQTDLLKEFDETKLVHDNDFEARPREAAQFVLNELLIAPIPFLEKAIDKAAGP
jgi:hypothetical protein